MRKWMKQLIKTTVTAGMAALVMSFTALASGWEIQPETGRWRYELDGGRYYAAEAETPRWEWLDGNADGIAECYAFDGEGWMYAGTRTPDGYDVNSEGAWVINGVVQTMAVAAGYGGTMGQTASSNILIAYFSHTGTTEEAARQIQQITGGDLFRIQTVNAYPDTYQATVDAARREVDSNARPALSSAVGNMSQYDTILVGYPIWWHTTPMAVNTFLESYDLTGKKVIPFCTSGGSDIEESMPAVRASAGNARVGTGLTANYVTEETIRTWLNANGV